MNRRLEFWWILSLWVLVAPLIPGQGETATFDHKESGIRLKYPRAFETIPVQPTEALIIGKFQRPAPYLAGKRDRHRRPESLTAFVLRSRATTTQPTTTQPSSFEDMVKRQNEIHDVKEFLKARFNVDTPVRVPDTEDDNDPETDEWYISPGAPHRGYVYARKVPGGIWGIVGFADAEVFDSFYKKYRAAGVSMSIPKGYDKVKRAGEELYAGKNYRDVDFRIEARNRMVKGWKALDTENFFIVYNTSNEGLIKRIARDLEAIRPKYMELFPPLGPIEAVSVVRVCQDITEYHKYGGPPGSGGYWNFVAKELVLFDYSNIPDEAERNRRSGSDKDTFIVLYHEGFHQYIFYAAGEVSPHSWFNEGLGDYFSGTVIYVDSPKVKEIGLNRWRMPVVKESVGDVERFIPLNTLMHAEQHEYYNRAKVRQMYAQGWALCYFLLRAKEAQEHAQWKDIIPDYFNALKDANEQLVAALPQTASLADRMKAQADARARALRVAIEDIDLEALETAWKTWITKTKDPWSSQRR